MCYLGYHLDLIITAMRLFTKTLAVAAVREQAVFIRNSVDACLAAQRLGNGFPSDAAKIMHRWAQQREAQQYQKMFHHGGHAPRGGG